MPELLTQEQFVRTIRNLEIERDQVCAWLCAGLGILYIIIGIFFFQSFANYSKTLFSLFSVFCSLFTYGLGECLCNWIFSARCPICGKRWIDVGLTIALHSCPYCHHKVFTEQTFSQIHLPELHSIKRVSLYSFLILLIIFLILVMGSESDEILSVFRWMMIYSGCVLLLSPLTLMFSKKWGQGLSFMNKRCPVCGERGVSAHERYTGNCSVCGSRTDPDWPPPELEPIANLPAWDERGKAPLECPYCPPGRLNLTLSNVWKIYGRCPNCCRKLVHDDDFNPSGGTAASSDGKKDAIFPRTLTDPGKTETRK